MKRREPMNNLWMVLAPAPAARFIHSSRSRTTGFIPIPS